MLHDFEKSRSGLHTAVVSRDVVRRVVDVLILFQEYPRPAQSALQHSRFSVLPSSVSEGPFAPRKSVSRPSPLLSSLFLLFLRFLRFTSAAAVVTSDTPVGKRVYAGGGTS